MNNKDFYRSPLWRQTAEDVKIRDLYSCVVCGKDPTEAQLQVHHRIPRVLCEDPYDQDNLITLCAGCHSQKETAEIVLFQRLEIATKSERELILQLYTEKERARERHRLSLYPPVG